MQNSNISPEFTLASLLVSAAEKKVLKKAVLSKPSDKSIVRTVITKKLISGKEALQIEKALPVKEKRRFRYINILANGSWITLVGMVAILFTNESRGILTEILYAMALLVFGGLFAYLFTKCFKNRLTYVPWVVTFMICFMVVRLGVIGVLRG